MNRPPPLFLTYRLLSVIIELILKLFARICTKLLIPQIYFRQIPIIYKIYKYREEKEYVNDSKIISKNRPK